MIKGGWGVPKGQGVGGLPLRGVSKGSEEKGGYPWRVFQEKGSKRGGITLGGFQRVKGGVGYP